jgi:N-dimethylarginine dimethylaminohydrolase
MPNPLINRTVLMSDADHFSVMELNPYSHGSDQPDTDTAVSEHTTIRKALQTAGVNVKSVESPDDCQDGVYTANWALVRGDTAVLSSLPAPRQSEEPYARRALEKLGKKVLEAPYRFSGQGDALPVGEYLIVGSHYRTDPRMHQFLADRLGYNVVSVQTIPQTDKAGNPVTNAVTGWPDSFFYDVDLAFSVLTPGLIAWCPEAFDRSSQDAIAELPFDKIEVTYDEAVLGFACNLVSTGETVIMSSRAPKFQAAIESKGLNVVPVWAGNLAKGGGFIRCTTLTLDNL